MRLRLYLSLATLVLWIGASATAFAAPTDLEIQQKVRAALEAIDDLQSLQVDVRAGLVVLNGTALSASAATKAEELASKMEGVVGVENKLKRSTNVKDRLAPALRRLRSLGLETLAWLPLFGVALVIVLLGWLLARLISGWDWLFQKLSKNRFARDLLRQIVSALVFLGGLLLALEVLDATALVGAVLGTAGIVGLAVGFAFRDLFENYLASILLSVRRPFGPGDHVRIGDDEGKVALLTTRATILRTLDGNHLRILNSDVYKSRILNYTRNSLRRFDFTVGVGVDEDLVAARRLGRETLHAVDGVLDEPAPLVVIEELGDSSVQMRHYGWVDQTDADFQKVRGEAIRRIKLAFDDAEFDMPEPIQRIRLERWHKPDSTSDQPPATRSREEEREDIRPERHLDEAIAEERAAAGIDDLLGEPVEANAPIDG